MNAQIREVQKVILKAFSGVKTRFALAGGTALELYYLNHRFSSDLDFFSRKFNRTEIGKLISAFEKQVGRRIRLESELMQEGRASIQFYTLPVKGTDRVLKIDFVEDVFLKKPRIRKFKGVSVYSAEDIYFLKMIAVAGHRPVINEMGRWMMEGRHEARDVFDLFMLSREVKPLHLFLQNIPSPWQRGMIHWYRTFSRQAFQLAFLDMDIYDRKIDFRQVILHLENEIKLFTKGLLKNE